MTEKGNRTAAFFFFHKKLALTTDLGELCDVVLFFEGYFEETGLGQKAFLAYFIVFAYLRKGASVFIDIFLPLFKCCDAFPADEEQFFDLKDY